MKIILSKYAGFCYGVDRAIKTTDKILSENPDKKTYLLGELVHNQEVIKKIKEKNIEIVKDIKKIPKKSLTILSAHGHSPARYKQAEDKQLNIIDATCPMVKKVFALGKKLVKDGYFIIIIGDKKHGEVKAIYAQIKTDTNKIKIIETVKDVKKIKKESRIGIVSQTTQSLSNFKEIIAEIAINAGELKIFNTICDATRFRQQAAIDLAQTVDLMIVVGSFNSANTKRLTDICSKIIKTYQVNTSDEVNKNWFKNKTTIGVSAGASTPDWIIKKVVNKIKNY